MGHEIRLSMNANHMRMAHSGHVAFCAGRRRCLPAYQMEGMIMDSSPFYGLVRRFGRFQSRRQALRDLAGVAAGSSALVLSTGAQAQDATPAAEASPLETEIAWMPEGKVKEGT